MKLISTTAFILMLAFHNPFSAAGEFPFPEERNEVSLMAELRAWPYWTDTEFHGRLKLQHNPLLDQYRVAGGSFEGYELGSRQTCLDWITRHSSLKTNADTDRPAVIFVHGLGRSPGCWLRFGRKFREAGFATYEFNYGSMRVPVTEVAEHLADAVNSLANFKQVHLVVHSMGGLVARAYNAAHHPDHLGRIVMLGTPNHGAIMADRLKDWTLYQIVCGEPGQQLVTGERGLASQLPAPQAEFAIIAGGFPTWNGVNPLVIGDNDGVVSVQSTRLSGATDFLLVPNVLHHALTRDDRVISAAKRFLHTGVLRESGEVEPVE
ncbi:alpha/beta hydrolase family protein [Calycomorphotria hydatis]|nr:alpha/beta hydrolase family protein [Calycomorphotria hydatis]